MGYVSAIGLSIPFHTNNSAVSGDLTSVTLLGNTIVTIHTYEKAVELLDKKGLIYSSRPGMEMLSLGGWANHVVIMPYGSPFVNVGG